MRSFSVAARRPLRDRALAVFVLTLAMIRLSGRRSFGQRRPFDACIAVLPGSVLSRAVVGASPFWPTVFACFALVAVRRLVSVASCRSPWFERLASGDKRELVSGAMAGPLTSSASITRPAPDRSRRAGPLAPTGSPHRQFKPVHSLGPQVDEVAIVQNDTVGFPVQRVVQSRDEPLLLVLWHSACRNRSMLNETRRSALKRVIDAAKESFAVGGASARGEVLKTLAGAGLDALPRPGSGRTLERWQALADIAAADLSLVKLFEGHTDAQAILAEADSASDVGTTWGMWAAEAPGARVTFTERGGGACALKGTKAWCSGARHLDRGLLTVWRADGAGPFLAAVDLRQPGVGFDGMHWQAVGMSATDSHDVTFDDALARLVGIERFYLSRPGFWQGGAGIAACWHGAACALADALRQRTEEAPDAGWHRLLALGEIDRTLSANAALLREAAAWIDANPDADARAIALRTRAAAEEGAERVLRHVTRALGATPLCRDAAFARMAADLPVFIRQSHGDRDLVALGQALLGDGEISWRL